MEVKKIMRERRLREAAENIQRKSASAPHESENSQKEPSLQRISRQISAYSSRPSSQYGDAESPPEWYQHEEGNHTQVYEPKGSARSPDKNTDVGLDTVAEEEGLPFSPHLTQRSQPRDTQRSQPRENLRQAQVQPRDGKL